MTTFLKRDEIAAFIPSRQAQAAFDRMQQSVADTADAVGANVADTQKLNDAAFVTLSGNAELPNEYVLEVGDGIALVVSPGKVRLRLTNAAARVSGGFRILFVAEGDSQVVVPLEGFLVTRGATETLTNKTLAAPSMSGLQDCVDDTAAAAASVPVGGIYRTASALKVRVS